MQTPPRTYSELASALSLSPATDARYGGRFHRHKGTCGGWCCILFVFGFLKQKPVKRERPLLKLDLLAVPSDPLSVLSQDGLQ